MMFLGLAKKVIGPPSNNNSRALIRTHEITVTPSE